MQYLLHFGRNVALIKLIFGICLFSQKMVGSRVYVGGLPFGVRERDLEKFFKGFGRIRDILIKNGYGFVVSFSFFHILYGKKYCRVYVMLN